MDKIKEQLKKRLKRFTLFAVLLALYFTGLFYPFTKTLHFEFNPLAQFRYYVENGFPIKMYLVMALIFELVALYFFYMEASKLDGMDKMGRLFRMSRKKQSYGDSHFEEPEEYEKVAVVQSAAKAYGTILGQIDDSGKHLINFRMDSKNRLNSHIAVVGASGSGKTFTFSKTYCYQTVKRRESIVLTDPDGGLYRDMAGYFEDNGYVVRRFDLKRPQKSDGWDCLKSIMPETAELDAQMFAQVVIDNVGNGKTSDIYSTGPMALLKALILRVYLGHDFPEEEKNIASVYKMIQNDGGEAFLDQMFDPDQLTPDEMPCLGPYLSFKQGSPNLRGNLITNLAIELQLLQNALIRRVLSTDEIDLLQPGKQPTAIFCIFPDDQSTFSFIVSLFFSMLFIKLIDFADSQPDGRLPVPVNFLMDEFPSIGRLPDWDRKMATIRKRGMSVAMILQNIRQFQNLYDESWETILANCATILCLGINDGETANLITKRIGDTSIEVSTEQHAATESPLAVRFNHSVGEGRRALLSYDELQKMDEDDSIIIFQGHNPILARKYPHILHPESKKLRPILRDEIPDITDTAARIARREDEAVRVALYEQEHPISEVDRSYVGVCEPERKPSPQERLMDIFRAWFNNIQVKKAKDELKEEAAAEDEEEEELIFQEEELEPLLMVDETQEVDEVILTPSETPAGEFSQTQAEPVIDTDIQIEEDEFPAYDDSPAPAEEFPQADKDGIAPPETPEGASQSHAEEQVVSQPSKPQKPRQEPVAGPGRVRFNTTVIQRTPDSGKMPPTKKKIAPDQE